MIEDIGYSAKDMSSVVKIGDRMYDHMREVAAKLDNTPEGQLIDFKRFGHFLLAFSKMSQAELYLILSQIEETSNVFQEGLEVGANAKIAMAKIQEKFTE